MNNIVNRFTQEVIFASEKAQTVSEAVKEAVRAGVSLNRANLAGVDLARTDLRGTYFYYADLYHADLHHANRTGLRLRRPVQAKLSGRLFRA